MANNNKLRVLFAGAELAPLVKVGGLGDVMGSLPKALVKMGVLAKAIIPFYGLPNLKKYRFSLVKNNIPMVIDKRSISFSLYKTKIPQSQVEVFLVKHKLFDYPQVYLGKRKYFRGGVYSRGSLDVERFVFFSKAIVASIKALRLPLDILHCHDWHTALAPTFIDEYSLRDKSFKNIKTLLTIHNLANQGIAGLDIVDYGALHHRLTPALMEDYYDKDGDKIDLMKIGILSADYINTVSPNYAKEILTKEYGEGLEDYLKRRQKDLAGILNGLDYSVFNPETDKFIKQKFNLKNYLSLRPVNKKFLQKKLKLPIDDSLPLYGLVSRLVNQKGLDILLPSLRQLLKNTNIQVVILGDGQKEYEKSFLALAKKHSSKLSVKIGFDLALAQQIYAGSDFFLMPSKFEPCGLGQLIAMRYGAIPIVRRTGGLKDTVIDNKTGLVFKDYKVAELLRVIDRANKIYQNKSKINKIIKLGMSQDYSWDGSADKYIKLYNRLS